MEPLRGNEKRKESCKQVGGAKKRTGHAREDMFNRQYGEGDAITYKAEADCVISLENPAGAALHSLLVKDLKLTKAPGSRLSASLKSGKNLQFTLGNIPEITNAVDKVAAIQERSLWNKYLKKSDSARPADLLVYYDDVATTWTFFNMDAVIDFIVTRATWRSLTTGRIKGNLPAENKKGFRAILTYEYRQGKHNSHFLGANGNMGKHFIAILMKHLPSVTTTAVEK